MVLALYRRYRPESFVEVIGQDHVTGPLQQALRNDRVHHAYLFSGPRGCGKTTSARILARALNCELGPTPEPCGKCQSCLDLARGGSGSLDVIEIDAASHGGVDDARDLRERAFFTPASSRYKIYIVDEAHMVTTQGFNALLKLVEEPPEHVKFVFATTEPEKVIGTIRSRTHHYPFRLVPPGTLSAYLADLCAREGIDVDPTVLPLIVRAGGGSVRDALSVLDQLLSGAGAEGVTYQMAAALLGYSDRDLVDAVVDAFAATDGAAAFELVDRVVEAGHDPRRFVADLLDRVRDLILVDAVPDAAEKGLVVGPVEQVAALAGQAARFGRIELARAAEILNVGLTEMRGATAPRLQLELIVARVLLPAATADDIGLGARVDRLERRLSIATSAAPDATAAAGSSATTAEPTQPEPVGPTSTPADRTGTPGRAAAPGPSDSGDPAGSSGPASSSAPTDSTGPAGSTGPASSSDHADPTVVTDPAGPAHSTKPPRLDIIEVRRLWPNVLDKIRDTKKVTWIMLFEKVTVASVDAERLVIAFPDGGSLKAFAAGGSSPRHDTVVHDAVAHVLGLSLEIDSVLDSSRAPTRESASGPTGPSSPQRSAAAADRRMPRPSGDTLVAPARPDAAPSSAPASPAHPAGASAIPGPPSDRGGADPALDPDADDSGLSEEDLLTRELGATVVERVSDA